MLFNGIDPRAVVPGIISIRSTVDDAMPSRSLKLVQLRRGAGYAGLTLGPRKIVVSINIGARRRSQALEVSRKLVGWASSNVPCQLVLNHEPDKYYDAICSDCSPKMLKNTFIVLDFTFTAPDPRAFEIDEMQALPGIPFDVTGTAWATPVITQVLSAEAHNPRYTLNGMQYVELVGIIPAGSKVEIDHATRMVCVNNLIRHDLLDYVHSRWFELEAGRHTITSSAAGNASIRWRNAWL